MSSLLIEHALMYMYIHTHTHVYVHPCISKQKREGGGGNLPFFTLQYKKMFSIRKEENDRKWNDGHYHSVAEQSCSRSTPRKSLSRTLSTFLTPRDPSLINNSKMSSRPSSVWSHTHVHTDTATHTYMIHTRTHARTHTHTHTHIYNYTKNGKNIQCVVQAFLGIPL